MADPNYKTVPQNVLLSDAIWISSTVLLFQNILQTNIGLKHPVIFAIEWILFVVLICFTACFVDYKDLRGRSKAKAAIASTHAMLFVAGIHGITFTISDATREFLEHGIDEEHSIYVAFPSALFVAGLTALIASSIHLWTVKFGCFVETLK